MMFAGRNAGTSVRRIFIAVSDSLDGPWEVKNHSYPPMWPWEGRAIDLGPGNIVDDGVAFFFYSGAFPSLQQIVAQFPRKPHLPTTVNLMRYVKRRIGILRVGLREPNLIGSSRQPLPLKCTPGTPYESVFCPGYAILNNRHLLFTACSNYSRGYPYEQLVGVVEDKSTPREWFREKKISPVVTSKELPPPFSYQSAFDSPDPVPMGGNKLKLYFSAMNREVGSWSIMACDIAVD